MAGPTGESRPPKMAGQTVSRNPTLPWENGGGSLMGKPEDTLATPPTDDKEEWTVAKAPEEVETPGIPGTKREQSTVWRKGPPGDKAEEGDRGPAASGRGWDRGTEEGS